MEKKKEEAKKLAEKLRELIVEHHDAERADISNALMRLIQLNTIYILKNEAEEYKNSSTVTIYPSKVKLSYELNDDERENYYRIRAYSFGPFDPIEYFKSNCKILWILKEPFCENISEIDGSELKDYAQAAQYSTFGKVDKPTLKI